MIFYIFIMNYMEMYLQRQIQNVIISSPSTARIYQENNIKYIGIYFKPLRKIISDFFEKDSLYIKLAPIPYNKLFDQLEMESELILTLNILNRTKNLDNLIVEITLVEEDQNTGVITNSNFSTTRNVILSWGHIESFILPKFNISNINSLYLKIDAFFIDENDDNIKTIITYKSNPYTMILLNYSDNARKLMKSQIRQRSIQSDLLTLPCRRTNLYVNFSKIGWGSWIILPKSMNIYQCIGSCEYKSSFQVEMTDNALVRSLLTHPSQISRPCCVPNKLGAANFLIKNSIGVEEYQMKRLVVDSCTCQ